MFKSLPFWIIFNWNTCLMYCLSIYWWFIKLRLMFKCNSLYNMCYFIFFESIWCFRSLLLSILPCWIILNWITCLMHSLFYINWRCGKLCLMFKCNCLYNMCYNIFFEGIWCYYRSLMLIILPFWILFNWNTCLMHCLHTYKLCYLRKWYMFCLYRWILFRFFIDSCMYYMSIYRRFVKLQRMFKYYSLYFMCKYFFFESIWRCRSLLLIILPYWIIFSFRTTCLMYSLFFINWRCGKLCRMFKCNCLYNMCCNIFFEGS